MFATLNMTRSGKMSFLRLPLPSAGSSGAALHSGVTPTLGRSRAQERTARYRIHRSRSLSRGIDFDEIERLRAANPDMKIRAGIELDNDPVHSAAAAVGSRRIGTDSISSLARFITSSARIRCSTACRRRRAVRRRNIDEIYADYFRRVREMAATGLVDCLVASRSRSRFMAIGRRRRSKRLVGETLDLHCEIASVSAIELSTAGWRKPVNELYPSDRHHSNSRSRKEFHSRPLPTRIRTCSWARITIGSPRKMGELGIREVCVFEDRHQALDSACALR